MPTTAPPSPQLARLLHDPSAYPQAFARSEVLRPILQGHRPLGQQSPATGRPYHRLWGDLRRLQEAGLGGLLAHRPLPPPRGKPSLAERVPGPLQHEMVRLALAYPFTARALARRLQTCDEIASDHRGIPRVLARPPLSPDVLPRQDRSTQQAARPPLPAAPHLRFAYDPTTRAPRLIQALDPAHGLMRVRTSRAYPTAEQAR